MPLNRGVGMEETEVCTLDLQITLPCYKIVGYDQERYRLCETSTLFTLYLNFVAVA